MALSVTNYDDWKGGIRFVIHKIKRKGKAATPEDLEKLEAFRQMARLFVCCDHAEDLAKWIQSKSGFSQEELAAINSPHLRKALEALQPIAQQEEAQRFWEMGKAFKEAHNITY